MNQRQCAKCDSMVDAAKAFCPDCGEPMDAEQEREGTTEFDQHPATVQFSDSDFGRLMQKMDLDTSEHAEFKDEEEVAIQPEGTEGPDPVQPEVAKDPTPVYREVTEDPKPVQPEVAETTKPANNSDWIMAIIAGLIFAVLACLALILLLFFFIRT